jgi:hypothetical protein
MKRRLLLAALACAAISLTAAGARYVGVLPSFDSVTDVGKVAVVSPTGYVLTAASGDVTGSYGALTVRGLQGQALPTAVTGGFVKRNAANTGWEEVPYGTAANTVTQGNDSRLPTQDENDALIGTNGTPSLVNRYVTATDTTYSNAVQRTGDTMTGVLVAGSGAVCGRDAASNTTAPVDGTIRGGNAVTGGTADLDGGDVTVASGQSKGSKTGQVLIQASPRGPTGTQLNSLGTVAAFGQPAAACNTLPRLGSAVVGATVRMCNDLAGDYFFRDDLTVQGTIWANFGVNVASSRSLTLNEGSTIQWASANGQMNMSGSRAQGFSINDSFGNKFTEWDTIDYVTKQLVPFVLGKNAANNTSAPTGQTIRGGDNIAGGTANLDAGTVTISSGASKGTGNAHIDIKVSNEGSSGTALNTPQTVARFGQFSSADITTPVGNTSFELATGYFYCRAPVGFYGGVTINNGIEISAGSGGIEFNGASSSRNIRFPDNQSEALYFGQSTNRYMGFDSTDGAEAVTFTKPAKFINTTGNNAVVAPTGLQQALLFKDAAGSILGGMYTGGSIVPGAPTGISYNRSGMTVNGALMFTNPATIENQIMFPNIATGLRIVDLSGNQFMSFNGTGIITRFHTNWTYAGSSGSILVGDGGETAMQFASGSVTAYQGVLNIGNASGSSRINYSGTSGNNLLVVPTGQATALNIRDNGGTSYISLNSTTGGSTPAVTISQNLTSSGFYTNLNSTELNVNAARVFMSASQDWRYNAPQASTWKITSQYLGDIWKVTQTNLGANTGFQFDLLGTNTTTDAPTGYMGEYRSSCVTAASGATLSDSTTANATSLTLTSGDWDITTICTLNGNLTGTSFQCGLSTTSATMPGASAKGDSWVESPTMSTTAADTSLTVPSYRSTIAVGTTTTYYAAVRVVFSAGTAKAGACIKARRPR